MLICRCHHFGCTWHDPIDCHPGPEHLNQRVVAHSTLDSNMNPRCCLKCQPSSILGLMFFQCFKHVPYHIWYVYNIWYFILYFIYIIYTRIYTVCMFIICFYIRDPVYFIDLHSSTNDKCEAEKGVCTPTEAESQDRSGPWVKTVEAWHDTSRHHYVTYHSYVDMLIQTQLQNQSLFWNGVTNL